MLTSCRRLSSSSDVDVHSAGQQLEATTNTAKSPHHSQVSNSVISHTSSTNSKKDGRFGFTRREPPTRRPHLRPFRHLTSEESTFHYSAPGQRVLVSLGARARRQRPKSTIAESTDSVRPTRGAGRSGASPANSVTTKDKDEAEQQDNIKSTVGGEKQQVNSDNSNTSTTTITTTEKPNVLPRLRPITRFRPLTRRRPGSLTRQRGTRKFRQNVSLFLADREQNSASDNTDSTTNGDDATGRETTHAQAEPQSLKEQEGEKEEVAVDESSGEGAHGESDQQ